MEFTDFIAFLSFIGFLSDFFIFFRILSDFSQIGVGSPSLLSLHTRGKGIEQLTSLPNLISGFSSHDQQAWMDFIFESTNITEQTEQLEEAKTIYLYFSRKKSSHVRNRKKITNDNIISLL
jgi:hypothetical protein